MRNNVSKSEFYMWRAVFAFSLVNRMLTMEEQQILAKHMHSVPFTREQRQILFDDFKTPQDIEELYNHITDPKDKKRFCELARTLVWSKGDIDLQEKHILKRVGCMNTPEDRKLLHETRNSNWVRNYTENYEKAGLLGMMQHPHIYRTQI